MKNYAAFIWAILLAITSCNRQSPQQSVSVFNWTDYIGTETISSFEQRANTKVTYANYGSNEELLAKLETGGASYDVIFPSAYAVEILLAKKHLHPIDLTIVTNRQLVLPEFAAPEFDPKLEYCVPYTWSSTAIAYDSGLVSDEEALSAKILFDSRLSGKILMLDDMRASIGIALKFLGYSANSTNPDELAKAKQVLLTQKPLVHLYASSNIPELLASGEVKVAYAWSGDILQAVRRNPKLRMVMPKEGALVYIDYMCIPKSSANPDGGSRFINHVLDPTVAKNIAETIRYAMPNSKVKGLVDAETAKLWDQMSYAKDRSKMETVKNVGDSLRLYDECWQAVKGGN